MYSENTAPHSATVDTMVAAIRNGDGTVVVDKADETISNSPAATNTSMIRSGIPLFICSSFIGELFFV
jgi:hypothetical protein